jgi:Spy/CpxP family protein refolding chaperone
LKTAKTLSASFGLAGMLLAGTLYAQQPPPHAPSMPPPPPPPPFVVGPPGVWWNNPVIVDRLAITPHQQSRMQALFEQNRRHLVELSDELRRQEAIIRPLLDTDHPDESRVLAQIDRIAQGRAELEKANARFILGIRNILTLDQWRKLKSEEAKRPAHM